MVHLESVSADGKHWAGAGGPAAGTVEWDAEIVDGRAEPAHRLAVAARTPTSPTPAGQLRAGAGRRGTEVRVELSYDPPAGALGHAVAKLFGEEPSQQVDDDLRRFKQVLETGEVVRSDGSPDGTPCASRPARPAQPLRAAADRPHGGD